MRFRNFTSYLLIYFSVFLQNFYIIFSRYTLHILHYYFVHLSHKCKSFYCIDSTQNFDANFFLWFLFKRKYYTNFTWKNYKNILRKKI